MRDTKTHGILLRKILLSNDDALLEFFTNDFGKTSFFIPKFARSKKKVCEIDFFRLIELEIFKGRNSNRIKNVKAISFFHGFDSSYSINEKGFFWLEILDKILAKEKIVPDFFSEIVNFFGHLDESNQQKMEAFFWVKVFVKLGVFPRFDQIRSMVYFNPSMGLFFPEKQKNTVEISNLSRQILEFLRRSNFEEFFEKKEKLASENFIEIEKVLFEFKKYHI